MFKVTFSKIRSAHILLAFLIASAACNREDIFIPDSPLLVNKIYQSPLTKKVVDKVNLVQSVVADSLTEIAPGVKQTTINYLDYSNKPMRLFIIEADLNNPKITMKAGTPNNRTAYARQTVSEIARLQDTIGNRVLSAVNGDFFNAATNDILKTCYFRNGLSCISRSIIWRACFHSNFWVV